MIMKVRKCDVEFESEIMVEVIVEAVISSGSPAPPCQDPSSPAFSDCGDPGGVEEMSVYLWRKVRRGDSYTIKKLDITQFIDDDVEKELTERAERETEGME
jgi:hypothetical protein